MQFNGTCMYNIVYAIVAMIVLSIYEGVEQGINHLQPQHFGGI